MAKAKADNRPAPETPPAGEDKVPDFESALEELEQIIERLEGGELSLEHSLKEFERGVRLSRTCHQALQQAEQRVQQLIEEDGQLRFEDFDLPPEP